MASSGWGGQYVAVSKILYQAVLVLVVRQRVSIQPRRKRLEEPCTLGCSAGLHDFPLTQAPNPQPHSTTVLPVRVVVGYFCIEYSEQYLKVLYSCVHVYYHTIRIDLVDLFE